MIGVERHGRRARSALTIGDRVPEGIRAAGLRGGVDQRMGTVTGGGSEALGSENSAVNVIAGPCSLALPAISCVTGASFSPMIVTVAVWVALPPLPSSTV